MIGIPNEESIKGSRGQQFGFLVNASDINRLLPAVSWIHSIHGIVARPGTFSPEAINAGYYAEVVRRSYTGVPPVTVADSRLALIPLPGEPRRQLVVDSEKLGTSLGGGTNLILAVCELSGRNDFGPFDRAACSKTASAPSVSVTYTVHTKVEHIKDAMGMDQQILALVDRWRCK